MVGTKNIVSSGFWIFLRIFVTAFANVFVIAVLARRLAPSDFGVVALATVVFKLITLLSSEGVNQFIIHDTREGRDERCQAIFWINLTIACCSVALGFLIIPWLKNFFEDPRLSEILAVTLLAAPIQSLARVPDALLRKEFRFKQLQIRDLAIALFAGAMSVIMVLQGFGVWSLVIPGLVSAVLRAVIVYAISSWRPKMRLNLHLWKSVFNYYANIVGTATTSFVVANGDTILVGHLFGSAFLGVYNMAWRAANLINRVVVNIGSQIALPVLALRGNGPEDIAEKGKAMVQALRILACLTFPMFVCIFVLADDFVLTIYGDQWQASIVLLRVLLIYALRFALSPPISAFFHAIARPDVTFKVGLVTVPFYLVGIILGSQFGVLGVAVAVASVRTAAGFMFFVVAARFMQVGLLKLLSPMAQPLGASLVMGAILYSIDMLLVHERLGSSLPSLLILIVLGAVLYWGIVRFLFRAVFDDLGRLLVRVLHGRHDWLIRLLRLPVNK